MSEIAPATKRFVELPFAELPKATAPSNDPTGVAVAATATMMTTTLDEDLNNGVSTTVAADVRNCNSDNSYISYAPTVPTEQSFPMIQRQVRSLNLPSHASMNGTSDGYGPPSLGYHIQQRMGRLSNGHANNGSTGAEPERLARQDAIQWTRKKEPLRKSSLGRTDDTLLAYDDGSDGEFESELFSSASASAAAAMAVEAASTANTQHNHNSRLPMGVVPRQHSLAVHSLVPTASGGCTSVGSASCALTTARMTRGVTCEELDFPVVPPSQQPPNRIAPTVSAPPYINKLPATPEEKNVNSRSPTISPSAASRLSRNAANPQLPHPIDANVRPQPMVAVTLNGCLRNGNSGSFNPLPSCASPSANGRLDTDYDSSGLHFDHKSRSLTNLENSATSRRVCISPASFVSDTNRDTVNTGQQWRHASSSAANLHQLNRQNLRLPDSSYAIGLKTTTDTVIHATSTMVPQNCMSHSSTSDFASIPQEMTASASSTVLTNANAAGNATSTVRLPRCESPIRIFSRQHHIVAERDGDVRLQQSLSTPCSSGGSEGTRSAVCHSALAKGSVGTGGTASGSSRKDSEYRRFRSEATTLA